MQETLIVALIGVCAAILFAVLLHNVRREKNNTSPGQEQYYAALSAYLSGDLDKALKKFHETIKVNTEIIDAYIKIGDILRALGAPEKSAKIHHDLLIRQNLSDDQQVSIYHALAEDYKAEKNYSLALEALDKLTLLDANDSWAGHFRIALHEATNDWQNATAAVAAHPALSREEQQCRIARYLTAQGAELAQNSKEHDARLRFREASKASPEYLPPYLELVDSYMRDGRPKAALTVLRQIVTFNTPYPDLIFGRLKQVLFELGLYGDLEKYYHEFQETPSTRVEASLGLCELYVKKGELDKAVDTCKTALSHEPQRLEALLMLTQLHLKLGQNDKAGENLAHIEAQLIARQSNFTCSSCGHHGGRFFFRCPNCQTWDTAQRG